MQCTNIRHAVYQISYSIESTYVFRKMKQMNQLPLYRLAKVDIEFHSIEDYPFNLRRHINIT